MCTSLEFNELFGSSFDVPCFVFSSFVVQFSRYRSLPLFATAYLVYHTQFRLSRGFLNFFQVSFRHFRPLKVTISCFFLRTPCLPCLSGTGSLAELYYITTFFSFCQPLFYLFFAFFSSFLPFLFDVSSFLSLFSRVLRFFCRKGWLRCDDSKHAKPRNFLHRKRVYSFRLYEKNQKYTRGLRTSGLRERFKSPVETVFLLK